MDDAQKLIDTLWAERDRTYAQLAALTAERDALRARLLAVAVATNSRDAIAARDDARAFLARATNTTEGGK